MNFILVASSWVTATLGQRRSGQSKFIGHIWIEISVSKIIVKLTNDPKWTEIVVIWLLTVRKIGTNPTYSPSKAEFDMDLLGVLFDREVLGMMQRVYLLERPLPKTKTEISTWFYQD